MLKKQQTNPIERRRPSFPCLGEIISWLRALAVIVAGVCGGASGTLWAGFGLLESRDKIVDTLPLIRVDGEDIEGSVRVRDVGEVTLIPRLEGGAHYYTLDGSEPSSSSLRYTVPIQVSQSSVIRQLSLSASGAEQATVRAVSVEVVGYDLRYQSGAESSDTWVDSFPPLIANNIEVEHSARVGDRAQIQLVSRFVGGLIFYTLDGSEPTSDSPQYRGPFSVDRTVVIRQLGTSWRI